MDPVDRWLEVPSGDVTLAVRNFGGSGETVLLLHGLAGHSEEWTTVAHALSDRFHVFALDLRGHGRSERRPTRVSHDSFTEDVNAVFQTLNPSEPSHLVGQSFGGHVAFLVAARYPACVRSLTVIEADPNGPNPAVIDEVTHWLASWPRPFPTRTAAVEFFGSATAATAWVEGLELREDGYWPRFDDDVLIGALTHVATRSWWDEWTRVICPTLIVRGENGQLSNDTAITMASSLSHASVAVVRDAGHDVHLDQPETLVRELRRSLT